MAKKQDTKAVETNVTQGTAFFDLGAYIAGVKSPDVAAQMASGYVFMLDVQIQKNARGILRTLTKHMQEEAGFESMKDIYSVLRTQEFLEEQMAVQGLTEDGAFATLARLLVIRPTAVMHAMDLAGMTFRWDGSPNVYPNKPLDEMFLDKPELKLNKVIAQRIKLSVERHADGALRKDIDAVIEKRIEREEQKLKDTATAMFEQRFCLAEIVQYADHHCAQFESIDGYSTDAERAGAAFHNLDVSMQRQLIMHVLSSAERAEQFAAGNSRMTDAEFDSISFSVIAVCKQLRAVLQGAKFTVAERVAAAAI